MDSLLKEIGTELIKYGAAKLLGTQLFKLLFGKDARLYQSSGDDVNPIRNDALCEVIRKDGSVSVWIGTRETGKTQGSYREAEMFDRPIYCVSPEERPPSWITQVNLNDIDDLPSNITLILQDLPAYMSNNDYNNELIIELERIVPLCRHKRKWHLIFNTQSAIQADKYILDCELAFMKPWGVLMEDVERPGIRRIYKNWVMPYFEGKSEYFIRTHAFMKSRTYVGGIAITKPPAGKEVVLIATQNQDGIYEVTSEEEMDARSED